MRHADPKRGGRKDAARGPRRIWWLALGTILALAVIITLALLRRQTEAGAPVASFPLPPAAPADTIQFDDFVGSQSCAGCHAAQFAAWSASTHGRAGQAPPGDLVLRRFNGEPIRFRDATVEPRATAGNYEFVVRWPAGVDHYRIEGVVGAGHMMGGGTQGFLWRHPDGSLRLLPFEIVRADSAWFCSTGTRANRGWQRITEQMSIADCGDWPPVRMFGSTERFASCQECHGSQIELVRNERPNDTRYRSLSVNCESCHGPGRRHQELASTEPGQADLGMQPLATLSRDASVLLCSRCHAIKVDIRRGYLPGRELEERYSLRFPLLDGDDTHPDGRTRMFSYQQGHLYSDCFLSGSMTCVDCHEPHSQEYRDINGRRLNGRLDDAQCTDCHASKAERPELHTKHAAGSTGSRCVACHMPFIQEAAVGTNIRYTRSDHTISIPRPDIDRKLGVVNACRTCHTDRSSEQLADDTRRLWGELKPLRASVAGLIESQSLEDLERIILAQDTLHGMAYFDALGRYFSRMDGPDAAALPRRLRAQLWQLTESRDDDHAALALAILHFDAGHLPEVRSRLIERLQGLGTRDLRVRRRWAIALGHRGDALRERRRTPEAMAAYQKALELLPGEISFLLALGLARLETGDARAASDLLQRALTIDERNSLLHINYGRARASLGDEAGARAAYQRATEVNPYDALAFFNLGNAWLREGDRARALGAYTRATELDASLAPAHFNRARILLINGDERAALSAVRSGLIFDPNHAEARAVAEELQARLGSAAPR